MTSRELLIAWLNDAYAMERSLEDTLKRHLKDAEGEPEVHARIQRHIEETRRQAETVRSCVEALGGKVSKVKTLFAEMMGTVQGVANKPAGDTLVKNALADYAAEHFEIASYRALIAAARALGEEEVAVRLTGVLREEEDMARFLEERLPHAVRGAVADADG